MNKLKETLIYILSKYPHKQELSNARVTKLVYLSDWLHAIHFNSQISQIDWYFDNYGPFVWDVYQLAKTDESFKIEFTQNYFGKEKKLISLQGKIDANLTNEEMLSIDKAIESTKSLNWDDFINLVYSTYPILTSDKYNKLNLIEKAQQLIASKTNK